MVWAYNEPEDCPVPQFLDANFSLKRLAADGTASTNPWRSNMLPCLTGSGQYIMRWRSKVQPDFDGSASLASSGEVQLRQVDGVELLQVIGLDVSYFYNNVPTHKLATSFAGNAFSGFAMIPILTAVAATVTPDAVWSRPSRAVAEVESEGSGFDD